LNTTVEAIAAADRSRRYHRLERTVVVCTAIVLSFAMLVVLILGIRQNELRHLSERNDCRSAIRDEFDTIKDQRFNTLLTTVFNHKPPGTPLTDAENKNILNQETRVDALPKISDAVEHGYTLDGVHHPPCPKVS
jgi:hypothetical protein